MRNTYSYYLSHLKNQNPLLKAPRMHPILVLLLYFRARICVRGSEVNFDLFGSSISINKFLTESSFKRIPLYIKKNSIIALHVLV